MPTTIKKPLNPVSRAFQALRDYANKPYEPGLDDTPLTAGMKGFGKHLLSMAVPADEDAPFDMINPMSAGPAVTPLMAIGKRLSQNLPAIAPEAYKHVKSNIPRLYSRLTDVVAKLPELTHVNQIRSRVASGASKEEVGLRKLEEFLKGREGQKVNRADLMSHLEQHPLEVNVQRLTSDGENVIRDQAQQLQEHIHYLDTAYPGWAQAADLESVITDPEDLQTYRELLDAVDRNSGAYRTPRESTRWQGIAAPKFEQGGPPTGYKESVFTVPANLPAGINSQDVSTFPPDVYQSSHWGSIPNAFAHTRSEQRFLPPDPFDPNDFEAASRAARDTLDTAYTDNPGWAMGRMLHEAQSDLHQNALKDAICAVFDAHRDFASGNALRSGDISVSDALRSAYSVATPTEKLILDNAGYKTPVIQQLESDLDLGGHHLNDIWRDHPAYDLGGGGLSRRLADAVRNEGVEVGSYHDLYDDVDTMGIPEGVFTPEEEASIKELLQIRRDEYNTFREKKDVIEYLPPDLPYKHDWQDLALKSELMDFAANPDEKWFGILNGEDVAKAEGYLDSPRLRQGAAYNYDRVLPNKLNRLVAPFGLETEQFNWPIDVDPKSISMGTMTGIGGGDRASGPIMAGRNQLAWSIPDDSPTGMRDWRHNAALLNTQIAENPPKQIPGPGMSLLRHPEMDQIKRQMLERGFPAMAALLALQAARNRMNEQ